MATISEDYVSFEIAKLLKEKGFDESTSMVYMSYGDLRKLDRYDSIRNSNYNDITKNYFECTAPTQSMAMKWLRENFRLYVDIELLSGPSFSWYIWFMNDPQNLIGCFEDTAIHYYDSYEQACEAAIKYCLENLI